MSVAVISLPVPLSPMMSTVLSLLPMTRRNSKTARIRGLLPITTESIVICCEATIAAPSDETERLELRNLLANRRLDADVQRHMSAWTTGAHAGEPNIGGIAADPQELDVPAVGLEERPDPVQHVLNPLFRNHRHASARQRATAVPGKASIFRRICGFSAIRPIGGVGTISRGPDYSAPAGGCQLVVFSKW